MEQNEKDLSEDNVNTVKFLDSDVTGGQFYTNLTRNFSTIRKDRAIALTEKLELKYRRTLEDKKLELRDLLRKQEEMIDLAPSSVTSLTPADFNADEFIANDEKLIVGINNLEKLIEKKEARYIKLFGGR